MTRDTRDNGYDVGAIQESIWLLLARLKDTVLMRSVVGKRTHTGDRGDVGRDRPLQSAIAIARNAVGGTRSCVRPRQTVFFVSFSIETLPLRK